MSFAEWSNKKKKEREQNSSDVSVGKSNDSSFSDWSNNKVASRVSKDYVDTFITDVNNFFGSAEEDYGKLGWNNAQSTYRTQYSTLNDISARSNIIRTWLNQNKSRLGEKTYNEYSSFLDSLEKEGHTVVDAFKNFADNAARFETEHAYDTWYEGEKRREDEKQSVLSADDFEQYSQIGANIENPTYSEAMGGFSIGNWRPFGKDIGNIVTFSRDNIDSINEAIGTSNSNADIANVLGDHRYQLLEEDEVSVYNYYLGKKEYEKAEAYLASLDDILNQRWAEQISGRINGNAILEAAVGWGAGLENSLQGIRGLSDLFTGTETVPTYSATQYADQYASRDNEGFTKGLHDVASAVGGMMPSILVSSITGGLVNPLIGQIGGALTTGASAAGNGYAEMRNLGYDEWQSRGYGLLVGASEATLQYALGGISKLGGKVTNNAIGKLVSKFDNALARTAIKLGGNMASEGLEEAIQTVLDPAIKALMTGESFDAPEWEEVWYSALVGALTAGVFEGLPTIAGEANVRKQGANLKASGIENVTALADMGKTFAEGTTANRLGNKVTENSSPYQIGRLLEEVGGSLSERNIADIASDLQAKGMSPEEAMKTAQWLYKAAEGGTYTRKQQKAYLEDERISDVHKDLFTNEEHSVNKRNAEYDALYALAQEVTAPKSKAPSKNAPSQAEVSAQQAETVSPTENAPKTENATEVKFEASETGKTTYNGSEVKIQGVASVENGEVMVQLDNGEVVNARDVEFGNQEEALLYEAIVNMDTDTANDFIQGFNSMKNAPMTNPQTVSDYMLGFNEARTYGELGIPYEALARDGKYAIALDGNQTQIAYNRGKINSISKAKATQEAITSGSTKPTAKQTPRKYKGETHASEIKQSRAYKSLSKLQKAGVDGMVALYKALGIDVYFFESPTDSKGKRKGKNGYFNPEDNSVHIDLYAGIDGRGLIIYTGGHELTHYIRANLPEKFKAFADVLFEQYEAKGISVAGLIASKKHTLEQKGRITPDMTAEEAYDLAYEEVVADACEAMLGNGEAFAQISQKVKAKDEGLWNAIKKFFTDLVAKIKAAYAELNPDSYEGQKVAEMLETATDLQKMWVDMLVEASEVHGVSMEVTANDAMTGTDVSDITKKPVQKLQERTEYQEFPKEMIKITSSGAERSPMDIEINGKKFVGSASVRMLRNARFAENKFDPKYVTKVNKMLDKMRDYLAEARVKYTYVGLTDVYNAKIIISPTTGQIVLSGLVNNGDYEINFDFTKTCKKRIALQDVIEQLAREKGRVGEDGVQTEVDLSEENIRHINEVLAANGIETACLCCFVESKRYAMQAHFQEKVCDVWNRLVDEVNAEEDIFKEAPYFNFADSDIETSKIPDEEYDKLYADITRWRNYKFEDAGEGEGAIERKMKAFLINTPAARKKLRLSDFITEAGRTNLHKLYPDIESLAKAKIGTALPKAVESFAPYNGEIELLSVSGKEDLATYVKNIAGARSQSFSDFIMSHVYDVLQKTASLTARKLTAHTYTKEISRARLFGMTGEKTNLSVLHEVDPNVDSWNAGLKEDGSYFVSDYDAFRNGLCNQIQAIPDRESIALQNDPRYSRDCGRIGVGFSYNHMLKMHNDPDIRQVIGYHTSSLPAAIKPLTNLDKATDYTPVQNTLRFKGFKKPNYDIPDGVPSYATPPQDIEAGFKIGKNGQPTKTRMSKYAKSDATFDIKGKYEELCKTMDGTKAAKETLRQLLQFASDNGLALETSKYKNGHADFDLYGDTEATQNPYLSADNYIEYCISRGLVPMFYEFALNDNYYKDIYDFNVFDRLSYNPETGLHEDSADRKAYAPQVPVHMINEDGSMAFPKDFWTLVDKYMNDYNYQREDFANKFPKIMQEVRSIKDSSGKPMISKQEIKYSDRSFDSQVDAVLNGADVNSTHLKLMDTPSLLQEAGLPNLPILMTAKHLRTITSTSGKGKGNYHGLDVEIVKNLPKYISSPVMIADSLTRDDSIVIITEAVDSENKPVIAAILLNGSGRLDGAHINANIMTSAYGKNNFQSFLDRIADSDSVIYWDKKKSQDLSVSLGVQFPNAITSLRSGVIIHQAKAFVNTQNEKILYSDRAPDSLSNRSLLANALESVAQNDIERNKLAQYKSKLALIESEQAKLAEVKKKANDIRFTKGRTADETKQMKALEFEANQIANRINTYDRQLLNLEATAALKGVLQREKQLAYKKAEQKGKEALAKQRERDAKTQRELLTRYQESRKKGVEGRRKTEMRDKIKNVVNELNQYLLNGTKEKHVPIELQKAVAEALDAVNMDTVSAEERIAKKRDEMMKAKTPEAIERLAKEIATIQEMGSNMDAKLARLKTAYDNIINSDDPLIANSHDDVISNSIDRVAEVIGDTPLRDMSLHQLEAVYDLYKMVLHSIRATNKAFKAEKGEAISTIANGVISELEGKKRKSPYTTKAKEKVSEFDWNNLKPVYAFERVGSANFTKVFNAVRAGEDVWANDMSDAQAFREEQFKKYKYDTWDFKKRYGFTSTSGNHFELTLDQILSLYAFSKRAQAGDHLKYGGFVFDGLTEVKSKNKVGMTVTYQLKDATAYNLSEGTLAEIIEKLTPEQKEFADVMQDYLSTVMGEKGNEVSLALYDIKLFKEKNYFPLKSAPQYLAKAKEQAQGEVKIKNSGFTKETNPKAKNPIVLSSFMDVWAGHVNEMSMYHAFTLPLEDFYRVYNYHTPADEKLQSMSVVSSLENAHGQAAANYIDQLLKDLNGGARSDPRETLGKSLMSNFKKSAVMASMSVVVQQPTAIVRAMALVNSRYFLGAKPTKKKHKEAWAEVKKYAPVAVIKEMGYFDTGMGKGSVEWLKGEKTLMDKVDDATSKLPALADEITWVAIWNAVKRETVHTHKHLQPNSDAFLKAVGERFTEVITKTQVYDSTLSRSANMRSKSTFMNMVTSFMAEPTTSINMLQDAFHKGNKKYFARTMGAVYGSVVLNAALVSIVYAMRDDDEDETFLEKYLSRFTTEVVDGANPLTYLPIVKDIWSIAQGFDVERADMSLVTDLFDSFQQTANVLNKDTSDMDDDELEAHKKEVAESILGIMDNFSSLAGIPVKNVRRDINGIINAITTVGTDMDGRETTAGSLGDNILGDLKDSIPVWGWFPDESKGDKLYDAIIKGDSDYINRLKSGYASEESYHSAVKKIVRERYEDGDISASEAERIIVNHGGESEEEAFAKVQYWGFKRDYPSYDLSEEAVAKYYTDVEPVGIDIDVYYDYYKLKAKCKGVDEDGDGQTDSGTKKAEIMEVIDSLPISDQQKDALYYLNGWSANTIWQAPWH